MTSAKKDKAISALETVHAALKPLKPSDRARVLASVRALLESPANPMEAPMAPEVSESPASSSPITPVHPRPLAIRELVQDKKPGSHPQFITLFAYYREKYQNQPTFSRDDLKQYYVLSRENPPGNYDRDFVNAVRQGWIHEENDNSYITSRGIEAVESGFAGKNDGKTSPGRSKPAPKSRKGAERRTRSR
jgi:hypothetical protein